VNDFHSGTQNTQKPQQIDFYEGFDPTRGNPDHARFMDLINASERRGQIKNIVHEFAGITSPIHTAALVNGSGMGEPGRGAGPRSPGARRPCPDARCPDTVSREGNISFVETTFTTEK